MPDSMRIPKGRDKLIVLLWDERAPADLRKVLLDDCAPRLLDAGARYLSMTIDDEQATVSSPSPFPLFGKRARALVNLWLDADAPTDTVLEPLRSAGFEPAAYRVEESVYNDYGDNRHAEPRSWADGERSPGVTVVSFFARPKRIGPEEWGRRWFGNMSPVSERIQPRTRYVRNVVMKKLTEFGPAIDGLVEEAWPSPKHIKNPFLFYGASNPFTLVWNMLAIVRAVTFFLVLWRIETFTASEYFLRSGWESPDALP